MFTKEELLERYKTVSIKPVDLLKVEYFSSITHSCVSSESVYYLYRGHPKDFDCIVKFYCECLIEPDAEGFEFSVWKDNWRGWLPNGIDSALCIPMSASNFLWFIESTFDDVKHLVTLPSMDEFVGALQMSINQVWLEMSVLAQFKSEYLFLRWHTTA